MNNDTTPVVLCEDDFKKLSELMNLGTKAHADHEMTLAHEIGRAIVVKNAAFPVNTIRIGSIVKVKDLGSNKEKEFQIVMPPDADIKTQKISILSPMAAAIIGFRTGDEVNWKMPSGLKKLKILEVTSSLPA